MKINIVNLWSCNQSVALKHAIIGQHVNGTAKFQSFDKKLYRFAFKFQYYFTVSVNLFPTLCLHALLIICISSSFFHFLPVFSSFFQKKLEEIPFFQFLPFFPEETYFFRKFPNTGSSMSDSEFSCLIASTNK